MATARAHGASSASATANGTSVDAATEHDQADETADLQYGLLLFFAEALAEVCALPAWDDQCVELAFDKIKEWAILSSEHALYDEAALLKHKELWNLVTCDKNGNEREHSFFAWCRKNYAIREAAGIAKEHAASETEASQWFKIEDAHGARHCRPDMQSRFACFCNFDEQWFRNEANIFRLHPNSIPNHSKSSPK